jgi:hypothetical protein
MSCPHAFGQRLGRQAWGVEIEVRHAALRSQGGQFRPVYGTAAAATTRLWTSAAPRYSTFRFAVRDDHPRRPRGSRAPAAAPQAGCAAAAFVGAGRCIHARTAYGKAASVFFGYRAGMETVPRRKGLTNAAWSVVHLRRPTISAR